MSPSRPILVLNAGSSTLKFALLREEKHLVRGVIDAINPTGQGAVARIKDGTGKVLVDEFIGGVEHAAVLKWLWRWLPETFPDLAPAAVGHRVVHGGDTFSAPVRITPDILTQLEALAPLAPLHQPHNLAPIRHLLRTYPDLPQVACFDTAFHATQPRLERMFALPRRYFEQGVKRYGFHGLSYEYIATCLPDLEPRAARGRTVVCHLGNGVSLCALLGGKSVATTMGFSTLDGVPMGTRCGSLDPGVLLYLLDPEAPARYGLTLPDASSSEKRILSHSPREITHLLYHQSGLLGVSGVSSDMRELLASSQPEAAEAVELFCYRLARELGALAAVLGGLDALVFTAGIGENAALVRSKVCQRAAWLGVCIDEQANTEHRTRLDAPGSAVAVLVIPTDEERLIARHVTALLEGRATG